MQIPIRLTPRARGQILAPAFCAVLAAATACGGSGSVTASASASSPSASHTAATMSPAAAKSAIRSNWEAFFNPKTPVPRRVALLQNGQVFAPVIRAQAGSPLASSATGKVTKVRLVSPTQAHVTYSILVSGTPALTNQAGVAVYQDGTWKVGDASFCGLLTVENGGNTASLPAACKAGA